MRFDSVCLPCAPWVNWLRSESVQVSEWGVCVGCPWHDMPVSTRQHQKKTASSGYRRDITYCVLKRRKTPLTQPEA